MKRKSLRHHQCSIARTLDIVGEWWTPLILRDIAYGISRFGEIQEDLGISANVLADRLATLVAEGVLTTRLYQTRPERHEYGLTEKGAELAPVLIALMQWGDRWTWPGAEGPVRVVHGECGHTVRAELRCPHCERAVGLAELRPEPNAGVGGVPAEGEPGRVTAMRLRAATRR